MFADDACGDWTLFLDDEEAAAAPKAAEPSAAALEGFLLERRQADPAHFSDLPLSVVKRLGRGEYFREMPGEQMKGHFGLAVRDYPPSPAPNRRFPDLITQRLLKAALAGNPPPYRDGELDELAKHCTVQEDNASKVERQVRKSAAALLLQRHPTWTAEQVKSALDAMPGVKSEQISVSVSQGVVTLVGPVDDSEQHKQIVRRVAQLDGVRQVVDDLQLIKGS